MKSGARLSRRALWCVALLTCLVVSSHVRAADAPTQPTESWYERPVAIVGSAFKVAGSAVGSLWHDAASLFAGSDPYDYLPNQASEDDRRFFAILDALGLQLSEIKTRGGIVSHPRYRFVAVREPSDVDIQRGERMLDEYRNSSGGLRARAKQRIVRSVLDVAGDKAFMLSAVVVDLWLWPTVNYEISARNTERATQRSTPP